MYIYTQSWNDFQTDGHIRTSYRELLGTADSIMQMDKQMRDAEEHLSDISQKCNTRHLDKAKSSGTRIIKEYHARGTQQNANASHLAMLQMCPRILVTLIKSGSSLQLIAKILVLSRHLHNRALSDSNSISFVNVLGLRLSKLRSRLLSIVDRHLADATLEADAIVDAMTAYSLVTNSSSANVLRHFLHVRLSAISVDPIDRDSSNQALDGLRLWMKTIQDTQSLFPRQVSNALNRIKHEPLLQDKGVINVQELDLDTHESFLDNEIRHFTPYVRHDDLDVATAAKLLSSWSTVALKAYVEVLGAFLDRINTFQSILDIRRECLQLWISSQGRTIGITKSECLDVLRKVFQKRLVKCIDDQATNISAVIQIVEKSLSDNNFVSLTADSLWSIDLVRLELSDGASQLTNRVRDRIRGASVLHDEVIRTYREWLTKMNLVRTSLLDLRSKKWTVEEFDDQEEDIEDLEDMRYRLEKEDLTELDDKLQTSSISAMELLKHGMQDQQQKLTNKPRAVGKAVFILRIIRDMQQSAREGIEYYDTSFPFVTDLQKLVIGPVIDKLIQKHKASMVAAMNQIQTPVRLLWDGEPESPIVPSSWPFRMLKSLHEDMAVIGFDIWTTSAVSKLQEVLRNAVTETFRTGASNKAAETAAQPPDLSTSNMNLESSKLHDKKDAKIQLLFDVLYLGTALSTHMVEADKDAAFDEVCAAISKEAGLPIAVSDRIGVSAVDYWKRTSLLFGLLARNGNL